MIGQTISNYKILEKLGEGGMGVVYKALDTKLNRHVALKFLPAFVTEDSEEKARFLQEAQAISSLNHPHIATIHDLEEIDEHKFIVLEYIEGGTLKQKVKHRQLPFREVLQYAVQMVEGLAYAHRKEIVHRDIKTDNMMMTSEGQIKIADFGLAKLKGATRLTRAGSTVGTAAYMSPEQARGEEVDHRSDIFSFGAVLYELATGELPFEGEHEAALLYEVVNTAPKPMKERRSDVPEELQRIIGKAMEKSATDRYQRIDEMLIDMKRLSKEFETREILKQTGVQAATQKKRVRWLVPALVLGSFAAIVVGLFFFFFPPSEPELGSERKMLVVLPFENLGSPEDEYFADGITDEIIARLAAVRSLGVIARTSAIQYKNTDKNLQQIGKELGVDYVLEGTVRWQRITDGPSRVRVTPQLIKVSDATHLWANVYDEVMHEVFQVQSDIAEQVTKSLNIALAEPERQSLEAKPTDHLEAYDYYLRGNDYYYYRGWNEENWRIAAEMFTKAIELDQNFALAYAGLSQVHTGIYWFHYDRTDERLVKAKQAVDKALEIDPGLPEAHMSLGWYHYQGRLDYERALEEFAIAGRSQPNNSEIFHGTGAAQRRQGKWELAMDNFRKAATLDPRSAIIALDLAETYCLMRDYAEAERVLERAISLAPDWNPPYWWKVRLYLNWEGRTEKARKVLNEATQKVDPAELFFPSLWVDVFDGDYQAVLDRLSLERSEAFDDQFRYLPKSLLFAQIYGLMNQPKIEQAHYDSARSTLELRIKEQPQDPRYHSSLGIAYAGLGRKADAVREGKLAVQLLPVSKEAWKGVVLVEDLAHIYAMAGEYEAAIDQLEYLLSIPSDISRPLLRLDPTWAPLRDLPRFQKLVASE